MGKSGLIGRKIAATFSSTGISAFFLHPAEAFHGDLGLVTSEDIAIIISNSGATEEIIQLLPYFKRSKIKIISLTGNLNSVLAQYSDVVLDVSVEKEADPLGIVPTASTTALLAMGDALVSALLLKRNFSKEQFAIFHPGGSLGRKLLWRVSDLMHTGEKVPIVKEGVTIREAICEMTKKNLGVVFIVNNDSRLTGIFTDGDLRRLLERDSSPLELSIVESMMHTPKVISENALAAEAVRMMEDQAITILPVVDEKIRPFGAIHLHDLVRARLI